jgi:hypothetical protein
MRTVTALANIICRRSLLESFQERYKDQPWRAVDDCLKSLLLGLMERKARQVQQADRTECLKQALGDRYDTAMNLVHEINTTRLDRAKRGCGKQGCLARDAKDGYRSPSLRGVIPPPVKQIFFLNRLCRVVKHTPASKLAEQDWEALIADAQNDLVSYREWCAQGLSSTEPMPSHPNSPPDNESPRKRSIPEALLSEILPQRRTRPRITSAN